MTDRPTGSDQTDIDVHCEAKLAGLHCTKNKTFWWSTMWPVSQSCKPALVGCVLAPYLFMFQHSLGDRQSSDTSWSGWMAVFYG